MDYDSASNLALEGSLQESPDILSGNGPSCSKATSMSSSAPPSADIDNEKIFSAANLFNPHVHRENRLRLQKQKALKAVAKYNTFLNQQRMNERRCSFDLQTNIVHVPRRPVNVLPVDPDLARNLANTNGSLAPTKIMMVTKSADAYPVALMHYPAQYATTVPIFTPKELSFLPLNTAVHSASSFAVQCLNMSAEEYQRLKSRDGVNHGIVDSDEDSDASDNEQTKNEKKEEETVTDQPEEPQPGTASSKKRKQKSDETPLKGTTKETERPDPGIANVSKELDMSALPAPKEEMYPCPPNKCYACHVRERQPVIKSEYDFAPPKKKNRKVLPEMNAAMLDKEKKIGCSKCEKKFHPSCMHLPKATLFCITKYPWQCPDCKICLKCTRATQEEKLMFCDLCDRGYHSFCVGVPRIPHGRWLCEQCAKCSQCGSEKANLNGKRGRACIWQIDWEEDDEGNVTSVSSLCFPCHKKAKLAKGGDGEVVPEDEHGEESNALSEHKVS
ncbi:hypothetical protein RvY_14327 [Ramazzottius varieornatus]|uniref:PHD-type domain-containing protein n=1 Tax=Ramazzottius varieornatus TaxID=947166 RepID=A0A1D1VY83_RAMVA|nr:hypothetical protein RvY_14327 [Ramazzottius varieornatus]